MQFRYEEDPEWPPLAWLAVCKPGCQDVLVRHGRDVETHAEWFAEAVWAGPYEAGNLDCTDIVFGSGARMRDGHVIFVSAASTVDRLQSFAHSAGILISNSLPCLTRIAGATLDPEYANYARDFRSIVRGVRRYRPHIRTQHGPIQLTYYHNLRWDGAALHEASKPSIPRAFTSFARYRGFLDSCLDRLVMNMTDPNRARPYQLMGTMSAGYDSPTVAVLGQQHGLTEVLSFERYDLDPDSGAPLARRLGLRVLRVPRDAWKDERYPEVPFLASDAKGEDVYFRGAEHLLRGRVLLTGFHGDKVWDRDTTALSPDLVRGDQSGLSLSEYRLRAGFIHCPVPFLGARQIRDIHALSRSAEMRPWDTPGPYSRPICRRIVEEAGIARTSFGMKKRVASVLFFDRTSFLTSSSLADYEDWLETSTLNGHRPAGRRAITTTVTHFVLRITARAMEAVAGRSPRNIARLLGRISSRLLALTRREPRFRHLLPWALQRAMPAYPTDPPKRGDAPHRMRSREHRELVEGRESVSALSRYTR